MRAALVVVVAWAHFAVGVQHLRSLAQGKPKFEFHLCQNVSSCAACIIQEHCGWGQNEGSQGTCVHGSEFAPSLGTGANFSCWKFTRCEGTQELNCYSKTEPVDNTAVTKAVEAREVVYKDDQAFAKHNLDQLTAHKASLDALINQLKLRLGICKENQNLKSSAAETTNEQFRLLKKDLDDTELQVSETFESLQQEKEKAKSASSGKAAILSLVAKLEERLVTAKKAEAKAKTAVAPFEQKKMLASLDADQQSVVCEKQELALKKAEIHSHLTTVNLQWRKEAESARKHDAQTLQSLLEHGLPGEENGVPGDFDLMPLGTAPNKPVVAEQGDAAPPSPEIPSTGNLESVDKWFAKLVGNEK